MVEVELVGVRVELPSNTPIVLLRELTGERRLLPILIGGPEATAISFALDGVETSRPMTHDLLKILIEELDATVESIAVTELRDRTFYAEVSLRHDAGLKVVSCRPSDAIALGVRVGVTIHADEAVLDEAGYVEPEVDEDEPVEDDDMVEQFKEFIDSVNPDDFAS